ncbi:MAG TPA: PAS domain S-box protein, partial [Anaerolineae bacterium]
MADLKTRILHIEDNPGDARLVKEMLADAEPANYDLIQVARLDQALATLASESIEIILADLGLPDSQGLETIKRLRAAFPELPVIVMSGMSDETVAVQAVQEGAQDYIVKGLVDLHTCTRAIRYAIERKRAAEALRQSEEKYRLLVENVTVGIIVAQEGVVKYSNRKAQEIAGYTHDELVSMPFTDLIHPDDLEQTIGYYLGFLNGEKTPQNHIFRSVGKDGQLKWLESNAVLITWEGYPATLNFLTVVTERKQREFELEAIAAMGVALRVAESRAEMLSLILDQLCDLVKAQGAALALRDPVSGEIVIEMGRGAWADSTGWRLSPGRSVSEHVIVTGER